MARGGYIPDWQRALIVLSATVVAAILVLTLYWARTIFVPIALAIFLTFVLSPVVAWMQRRGTGRGAAVVVTIGLAVLITAGTGAVIAQQLTDLATELSEPDKAAEITAKVAATRDRVIGGGESRIGKLVDDVSAILFPTPAQKAASREQAETAVLGGPAAVAGGSAAGALEPGAQAPVPVSVESSGASWMDRAEGLITPATELLGQAAFAFILTVFMLLKKQDLRNRMIRLTSHGKVTTTTKAVDDASRRISRFLLTQLALNAAFGIVIVLGLLVIGVEYALLWGFLAFLMRYVPFIGTWLGVIPPALFAFAVYDPLWVPVAVVALFIGLELLCNNIFEPLLYGASMGLSEVAQLVAAGLWAFLWGPLGLILSGPLTVCLLVLGKYVSRFQYLEVLLGDEPVLEPQVAFYQRLTARDQDEASDIALQAAEETEPVDVFDRVIIPALCLAKQDEADGDLSTEDVRFVVRAAREVAVEIVAAHPAKTTGGAAVERVRVLLCPAHDEVDHVGIDLLAHLLDPTRWEVTVTADESLASELLTRIEATRPAVVVIGSLPPGGMSHTRYLVARVRSRFPDLKLIIGRWGRDEQFPDEPAAAGRAQADWVDTTLAATRKRLNEWHSVFTAGAGSADTGGESDGKTRILGTAGASTR